MEDPRTRLAALLRSFPALSLHAMGERAVLAARCFKVLHLCDQIGYRDVGSIPPTLNASEGALVSELAALAGYLHQRQAVAIVRDRAAILESSLVE